MPDGSEAGRKRRSLHIALMGLVGGIAFLSALLWTVWTLIPVPGDSPGSPAAGGTVTLDNVPDHVLKAVMATEDAAHDRSRDVTLEASARALSFAVAGKGTRDSALTQRMVHNHRPDEGSLLHRLADLAVALKVDLTKSREWVLERYLNVLDVGRGPEGIQSAAQAFFGKNVQDLTVAEGAYLAAAIRRPGDFTDASGERRTDLPTRWREVIESLHHSGVLTEQQAAVQRLPQIRTARPAGPGEAGPKVIAARGMAEMRRTVASALRPEAPVRKRSRLARQECPPGSIICEENSLPGSPPSEWDIVGSGSSEIQGYATQMSVTHGETIQFKVNTVATDYRLDIYRYGYYGGLGARLITTIQPSATLPQTQPACLNDLTTGLIDCGNWAVSASWTVPNTAVSGVFFAKLVREDGTAGSSHVTFVVRDDVRQSDVLFKTSDTTWQAYNKYGGNSLYAGMPANRAYAVSYNRPFITRGGANNGTASWFSNSEYPMVRWLEANAYDVSYISGIDAAARPAELLEHEILLSVGHDEYWSDDQRANITAARDSGVSLAFFSGNEMFWKTRWEPSIDGTNTPFRTMVCYKETHANAKIDPSPQWTGTWRDTRFSPPSDGGRPENGLSGTLFMINGIVNDEMLVPADYASMRLWRNTSIANLSPGQVATFPAGVLGSEWDETPFNGVQPAGLVKLSRTTLTYTNKYLLDFGSTYGAGTGTHNLTLYRHNSGAVVFGAGTIQWSWGLDATHDRAGTPTDIRMQQATVNLFADMGAQPAELQPGLVPATPSTDTAPPTSTITSPASGASVLSGTPITVQGTASDTGGGVVAGVEVSVNGGSTWMPATGLSAWQFTFTPGTPGPVTIQVRAVDDIGNIQTPLTTRNITVISDCPCTIWPATTTPAVASHTDTKSVELGVKFRTDKEGVIYGVRFYKGSFNTGTHIGNLWTSTGQLLARATFTGETASGWQEVRFGTPVPVTPGTTYVASYFAPDGRYSLNSQYFGSNVVSGPLTALSSGSSGGNGVYRYGSSTGFPTSSFRASNYWVDVVFSPTSLWESTTVPAVQNASDARAVVVGVKFKSTASGTIRGIRFYKGSQNTGTHVGSLWTSSGQLLASATFTNETASGWQQVLFSTPVPITENTTYVASYHTPSGRFSFDLDYFATQHVNSPLVALANGAQGGNGIYAYSAANSFPNRTFRATNYWVDVVFNAD